MDSGSPPATATGFVPVVTRACWTDPVQHLEDRLHKRDGKCLLYHLNSPLLDDLELLSLANAYELRVNLSN
jgi:hypothetical protein